MLTLLIVKELTWDTWTSLASHKDGLITIQETTIQLKIIVWPNKKDLLLLGLCKQNNFDLG